MHNQTRPTRTEVAMGLISSTLLAALIAAQAGAATPKRAGGAATWREECSGCHVAFPARLLPATSWNALLDGLDHHFGVDASLAPGPLSEVRDYLAPASEAGTRSARPQSAPRITTTDWFRREHSEIATQVWRRPAIRSAANCDACHAGAAQGNFDEDSVRVPR